jgi:L-lysine 2,3-aminomutase
MKKQIIYNLSKLLQLLNLEHKSELLSRDTKKFPLRVPYNFAAKMTEGNYSDPLLLQILPKKEEQETSPDYIQDPLSEKNCTPIHGVVHKYPSKILLLTTNNCLIHCRFCFRRYCDDYIQNWDKVFAYIAQHNDINEVILSGGDPLTLANKKLASIILRLAEITNIKHLRIHTRIPIVYPKRIALKLTEALNVSRFRPVMVLHCNHPDEIDTDVINAIKTLRAAGISLYSQSVLLKGVNDNPEILINLCEKLFLSGIQPYYLHLLDKVMGAQHFNVELDTAKQLLRQITLKLPGYLVPKLVQEVPNSSVKNVIA